MTKHYDADDQKKLESWMGPYKIIEKNSEVNYTVKKGRKTMRMHVNRLKPFIKAQALGQKKKLCHLPNHGNDPDSAKIAPRPLNGCALGQLEALAVATAKNHRNRALGAEAETELEVGPILGRHVSGHIILHK